MKLWPFTNTKKQKAAEVQAKLAEDFLRADQADEAEARHILQQAMNRTMICHKCFAEFRTGEGLRTSKERHEVGVFCPKCDGFITGMKKMRLRT